MPEDNYDKALMSMTFYRIYLTVSVVCASGMLSKNFYAISKIA